MPLLDDRAVATVLVGLLVILAVAVAAELSCNGLMTPRSKSF